MAGLSTIKLEKEASIIGDVGRAMGPIVVASMALKGIDSISDAIHDKIQTRKFNGVIDYAKKKHPELRKVPQADLKNWMGAFHTLSPKMSVNNELGSTMLATVHDYGGNIDLATAKLIAETGEKRSKQNSGTDVLGYIGAGSSLTSKRKG